MTDDFTEANYRSLLLRSGASYSFRPFGTQEPCPHVLLRHDLDTSLQRAHALARIEADLGISATYFLFPRSLYYNLLHPESKALVQQILALGHHAGLHFDVSMEHEAQDLEWLVTAERDLLQSEFGVTIEAVSFHLAGDFQSRLPREPLVCGMVNAYSTDLQQRYKYVSDSNGVWRFDRWADLIDPSRHPRLHVLVHPEWWTPEALRPRQRLQRAIDGYARRMGQWYDDVTKTYGRPNY